MRFTLTVRDGLEQTPHIALRSGHLILSGIRSNFDPLIGNIVWALDQVDKLFDGLADVVVRAHLFTKIQTTSLFDPSAWTRPIAPIFSPA